MLEAGGDEDKTIAALCHDVPGDHGGEERLVEIRERFGERVAHILRGLSDHLGPEGGEKGPWQERKEGYIAHLATADHSTPLVCLADKTHNLRCTLDDLGWLVPVVWERFTTGTEGQAWIYG